MATADSRNAALHGFAILTAPEVVEQLHRISVAEYHRLGELGIIGKRTELIRRMVIDKVSKSSLQAWLSQVIADWLRAGVGEGWTVRCEAPVTLADSEPEPDVAVVRGSLDDYRTRHPTDAVLAVEVGISSEKLDREKALIYAESEFKEYWLFLPQRGIIEVYRDPQGGHYRSVETLTSSDTLSAQAFPELKLTLSDVLTNG